MLKWSNAIAVIAGSVLTVGIAEAFNGRAWPGLVLVFLGIVLFASSLALDK